MTERNLTINRDEGRALRPDVGSEKYLRPAVDIFESEDSWTFVADMPGVAKGGLDLNIEQGVLSIRGRVEKAGKGENIYREFSMGSFFRQFQLPTEIDVEKADAAMKNGVLILTLPKSEAAKPRRIEITTH